MRGDHPMVATLRILFKDMDVHEVASTLNELYPESLELPARMVQHHFMFGHNKGADDIANQLWQLQQARTNNFTHHLRIMPTYEEEMARPTTVTKPRWHP